MVVEVVVIEDQGDGHGNRYRGREGGREGGRARYACISTWA